MRKTRSYKELAQIPSFKERFEYLKLSGVLGDQTFGSKRYVNQRFYKSYEWDQARRQAILRDMGLDLGISDRLIQGVILVHHINPITEDDIILGRPKLFDLDNLICVSKITHNAIHYGDENSLQSEWTPRKPGDTCIWK